MILPILYIYECNFAGIFKMQIMESIIDTLLELSGSGFVLFVFVLFFILNKWYFNKFKDDKDSSVITKQSFSILIILVGLLILILTLPIDKSLKGQILSFLGIIISAAIALSSTTVLGNLIAGVMNNAMDRFKIGDLIKDSIEKILLSNCISGTHHHHHCFY